MPRYVAVYALAPFWEFGWTVRNPRFLTLVNNAHDAARLARAVREVLNVPTWVAEMPDERPAHVTVQQRCAEGRI